MKNQKGRQYTACLFIAVLLLITINAFRVPPIQAQSNPPSITTDKEDYSPEETVEITGAGFIPNAQVTLTLLFPNSTTETWAVIADGSGAFVTTYQLNGIEGIYTLTATDGINTATTTFTDCPWKIITVTATKGGKVICEYHADRTENKITVAEGTTKVFFVWAGTKIKFTAIPNEGCAFKKWDGKHFNPTENPQTVNAKSGITVTAYFKLSTTITNLNCDPNPVNKYGAITTKISGNLKSGTTGISGATIILSINIGDEWKQIGTATTTTSGLFEYYWDVPEDLANGFYVIKAEFAGNENYVGSYAVTSEGGRLHVIPEYLLGGLLAMLACFAAFAASKKFQRGSNPHNHK